MANEKKNTYITLHKNFARTDIPYTDKKTGEEKTFNSATLPKGTIIDGQDLSYYQFSPLFVNLSKFKGENFVDIPLLTEQEVWLRRSVLDGEGNPVLGDDGKPEQDIVKVMPAQIKDALDQQRREYLESRNKEKGEQSLSDKAAQAREGAEALSGDDVPFEQKTR